jgi:myosin-light-chain kinase
MIWIENRIKISNIKLSYRIQGGELFERVIDEDFVLTERACACFMKQICEAMEYLHSHKVIHLDMKVRNKKILFCENWIKLSFNRFQQPENVLCISKSGNRIKLIDFGFARRYDPSQKLQVTILEVPSCQTKSKE